MASDTLFFFLSQLESKSLFRGQFQAGSSCWVHPLFTALLLAKTLTQVVASVDSFVESFDLSFNSSFLNALF